MMGAGIPACRSVPKSAQPGQAGEALGYVERHQPRVQALPLLMADEVIEQLGEVERGRRGPESHGGGGEVGVVQAAPRLTPLAQTRNSTSKTVIGRWALGEVAPSAFGMRAT